MGTYTYRIPPCPYWDTNTMEVWLEKMAQKGLFLGQEGIFPGIIAFEKGQPRQIRYRLIASEHPYRKARAYRYAPVPDEKTQNFYREFGWQYIATRRDFHIYACTDPNAPEMNTDPQIQAMAFSQAAKRQKTDVICYSLIVAAYLAVLLMQLWDYLSGTSRSLSLVNFWLIPLWLFYLIPSIRGYRQLRLRQKRLEEGSPLPDSPGYRKTAPGYWFGLLGKGLLFISVFAAVFTSPPTVYPEEDWIPLSAYTEQLPFATMDELLPDAQFREDSTWDNHICTRSTFLSDTVKLDQQLHITLPDGTQTSGSLDIVLRKIKVPGVARAQAEKEYRRGVRSQNEPTMLEVEGIDYAFCYKAYSYDFVVLQKGNAFLSVNFHIYSGNPITPEEIALAMAPYLTG